MSEESLPSRQPTLLDFQRNLDTIIHRGEREARIESGRLRSEFSSRGLGSSGPLISAVVTRGDQIHADTIRSAMELIVEFSRTNTSIPVMALTTRQRFESLAVMLLSTVPPAGRPEVAQRVRDQYAAVFQQRLDGALRDIEIGFVNGRRLNFAPAMETPAKLEDAIILRPTIMGVGIDLQKGWRWLKSFFSMNTS